MGDDLFSWCDKRCSSPSWNSLPDTFFLLNDYIENPWNPSVFIEKVVEKPKAEREQTAIPTMSTMYEACPPLFYTERAKRNDPWRRSTCSDEPARPARLSGHGRWVAMATS